LGEHGRQPRGEVGLPKRFLGSGIAAFQDDVVGGQITRPKF
jgi:hypothetical protein